MSGKICLLLWICLALATVKSKQTTENWINISNVYPLEVSILYDQDKEFDASHPKPELSQGTLGSLVIKHSNSSCHGS